MNVSETRQDGVLVRFDVTVTAEEMEPYFEKALDAMAKEADLPGFRKGKVPRKVVEQRFGEAARREALDEIVQGTYPGALEQTGLQPVAPGQVENIEFDPDKELTYTAVVEVEPEFDLGKWKGLKVEKEVPTVSEEDVERHLEGMRREQAVVSERDEGDPVQAGDRVTVDIQELDENGVAIIGRRQEDATFELGHDALGEGSDDQIVGMSPGASRKVRTTRHSHDESGAARDEEVLYEVSLKKAEAVQLPELDADFAAQVDEELKSVEDLKANVQEQLARYGEYKAQERFDGRMIDAIVEAHDFDVPPSLKQQTLGELVRKQKEQGYAQIEDEKLAELLEPVAERQLRWYFIRSRLLEELGLEVAEEEIEEHIAAYADRNEEADLESLKMMFASGERRENLRDEILNNKLLVALRDGVKPVEKKVDFLEVLQ